MKSIIENKILDVNLHAGNVLSAKEMLAKYPDDIELAMKEYAKQFVTISYQKSLVAIGPTYDIQFASPEFLLTQEMVEKYENQWVSVHPQSIMNVINYIK
jgi:hypothetical protein